SQRDQSLGRQYNRLLDGIEKSYDVHQIANIAVDSEPSAATKVLILAGTPDSVPDKVRDKLIAYLNRGGSALVFSAGMGMTGQSQFAQALGVSWNEVIKPYGVSIGSDMVLDLASNQPAQVPTQIGRVLVRYPPWLRALSTKSSVINKALDGAFLPWSSSIDTTGVKKGTLTPLFVTSRQTAVEGFRVLIYPTRQWPSDNLRPRLVAVQVNPLALDSGAKDGAK